MERLGVKILKNQRNKEVKLLEILKVTKKEFNLSCEPKGPCSPDCMPGGSCSPMCSPRVKSEGGEKMEIIKVTSSQSARSKRARDRIRPADYCRPCIPDWPPCPPHRKSKDDSGK